MLSTTVSAGLLLEGSLVSVHLWLPGGVSGHGLYQLQESCAEVFSFHPGVHKGREEQ